MSNHDRHEIFLFESLSLSDFFWLSGPRPNEPSSQRLASRLAEPFLNAFGSKSILTMQAEALQGFRLLMSALLLSEAALLVLVERVRDNCC